MKIRKITLHNFRSYSDAQFLLDNYSLLVGANNAGKSNLFKALLVFYEKIKFSSDDLPKVAENIDESWIEICYSLTNDEFENLPENYKNETKTLSVRKYLKSKDKEKVKANQSNLYAVVNDTIETNLFFGAKNIGQAKLGDLIFVPALSLPDDSLKMSGPSPLRDVLSLLLKKSAQKSEALQKISVAVAEFNDEARKPDGFISDIETPINKAIENWGIQFRLGIQPISPDHIVKSLVQHTFKENSLGEDNTLKIDDLGHGFQRTLIYELLKIAPSFGDIPVPKKKEFSPDFTLILFEEPENFLHPHQQEIMAYNLRELGRPEGQQVVVTTHSPLFVSKASQDLKQIIRIFKSQARSFVYQIDENRLNELLKDGKSFLKCLTEYVDNPDIPENKKAEARTLIANPPTEEIGIQEESFRYQLSLNADRASMFFADFVMVVEGPTDKVTFEYLLENKWRDLTKYRIYVVDAIGKYNIHRFIHLLEAFGIYHGVIMDGDKNKEHHAAVNPFICSKKNDFMKCDPHIFPVELETFLELPLPARKDKKPIEMLKLLCNGNIQEEKLVELKNIFTHCLLGVEPEN